MWCSQDLAIMTTGSKSFVQDEAVKTATKTRAFQLGLQQAGEQFVWKNRVPPEREPIEVDEYAHQLVTRLVEVQHTIAPLVRSALRSEERRVGKECPV